MPREKKTAIITIEVDLDEVPGWGNKPDDFASHIRHMMDETIGHYNPKIVRVVEGSRFKE